MCAARGVAPGTARQGGDLNKFLWTLAAGLAFASSIVAAQSGGPADRQTHPAAGSDHFMDAAFAERARNLNLKSSSALVVYQGTGRVLYAKNTETVVPIASITKLMTAMVTLDAKLSLDESVQISGADIDEIKGTRSRLRIGSLLTRSELLRLALMSSENRAAAALARTYPGSTAAFVAAMNQKAAELGMWSTRFVDSTGLSSDNVSTAQDLVKMVNAAYHYSLVREYTTGTAHAVSLAKGRILQYRNSNGLVKNPSWHIGLSKTGYISEAGRCLVMQAEIASMPVVIVLLDSWGKLSRMGDANRIKKWIESTSIRQIAG